MKTLTEIRPNIFVAPEIDGRARHILWLSTAISGFRLVIPKTGPAYVASFEPLGWRKIHDVTIDEARELTAGEPHPVDALDAELARACAGHALADHVLAMADDAYLVGHPEWEVIVDEARQLRACPTEATS